MDVLSILSHTFLQMVSHNKSSKSIRPAQVVLSHPGIRPRRAPTDGSYFGGVRVRVRVRVRIRVGVRARVRVRVRVRVS